MSHRLTDCGRLTYLPPSLDLEVWSEWFPALRDLEECKLPSLFAAAYWSYHLAVWRVLVVKFGTMTSNMRKGTHQVKFPSMLAGRVMSGLTVFHVLR